METLRGSLFIHVEQKCSAVCWQSTKIYIKTSRLHHATSVWSALAWWGICSLRICSHGIWGTLYTNMSTALSKWQAWFMQFRVNIGEGSGCRLALACSDLHSQTLALLRVTSLAVFFILFYLLIIFCLNLSIFYNSCQVVKTRKKKLNYNVNCNRRLHFPLPAMSLEFDTNRVHCQWRWDAVVVKRLKLISTITDRVLQVICKRKRQDPQIRGYRTAEYERNAQSFSLSVFLP